MQLEFELDLLFNSDITLLILWNNLGISFALHIVFNFSV